MMILRSARPGRWLLALGIIGPLTACGDPEAARNVAVVPEERTQDERPVKVETGLPGTPMAERVAEIGLLNKRNGITQKFTMKPGVALRSGNAIIRLRACETTAPWEMDKETGAFVQLDVLESRDNKWHRTFSGWLFKERPDRNVVLHPIYDVWVISCAMSWPETGPDTVRVADRSARSAGASGNESSASNAAEAPAAPSAPADSASPSNPE
ncbi:hypothetical protein M2336_002356 [Sphingobium sp. B1D7B]|nr:hypothetical protein [Sphingobium sp. B11D3A]MCW2394716.1 hypothetical protein [Sphingobium sp. B8D3B]MCW2405727.1 hypothetical protein [Sphingobium sp. B1D7B]MCW2418230.1 hypothetical protein [Sphingobium sp. B8D3C]